MYNKISIKIYKTLSDAFVAEWEELWANSEHSHYFNSLAWFKTCMEVFEYKDLEIICLYKKGKLVALLPLVVEKKYGVKLHVNPGGKFIDRSALLLGTYDKKLVLKMIKIMTTLGSFMLTEMPEEIKDIMQKNKNLIAREVSTNLYLPFENNPLQYLDREQKRKINKVLREHTGKFRFEMQRGNQEALQIAMTIDANSLRNQKGIGTFKNQDEKEFFIRFIECNKDNVGINILYYENVPIAYEIGVRSKGVYYGLNKSFDVNYKFLAPGKITAYFLFQGLCEEGIAMFDFSRGDDQLKRSFTNLSKKQYDIYYIQQIHRKMWLTALSNLRMFIVGTKPLYMSYRKVRTAI